ncbi:MAG: GldG family protein [Marinilabiliales bacterium]|nr:GldG family protein [Marinilabiliales bacterium]
MATATADTIHTVAFIEGHGELEEVYVADLTLELAKFFNIDRGVIGGRPGIIDHYAAIIIAAPDKPFDEKDKFIIDQYIMNGGRVLVAGRGGSSKRRQPHGGIDGSPL